MQPHDYVILFIGSFFSVGLLGIQSKNVNQSRYWAAAITCLLLCIANATFIKYVASGEFIPLAVAAIGSVCGITWSIWFYDNILKDWFDKRALKTARLVPTYIGPYEPPRPVAIEIKIDINGDDINGKKIELEQILKVINDAGH